MAPPTFPELFTRYRTDHGLGLTDIGYHAGIARDQLDRIADGAMLPGAAS